RFAELTRALAGGGPIADHSDLSENAEQLAPPRNAPNLDRPFDPLPARTHCAELFRVVVPLCLDARGLDRLDALTLQESLQRGAFDSEHATDADGVEAAVVDQAADGLGMDPKLAGNLTDCVER